MNEINLQRRQALKGPAQPRGWRGDRRGGYRQYLGDTTVKALDIAEHSAVVAWTDNKGDSTSAEAVIG